MSNRPLKCLLLYSKEEKQENFGKVFANLHTYTNIFIFILFFIVYVFGFLCRPAAFSEDQGTREELDCNIGSTEYET